MIKALEQLFFPERRLSPPDRRLFQAELTLDNLLRLKVIAAVGLAGHVVILLLARADLLTRAFPQPDAVIRLIWIGVCVVYLLAAGRPRRPEEVRPSHHALFLGGAVVCMILAGLLSGVRAAITSIVVYLVMALILAGFLYFSLGRAALVFIPGNLALIATVLLLKPDLTTRLSHVINSLVVTAFGLVLSQVIHRARLRQFLDTQTIARQTAELKRLSLVDGLTGLPNRRFLDETLGSEWRRAAREGRRLSLIMIDVDYFKLYNDRYGHQAGDECLRLLGRTISACLSREGDFLGRYGGEEFLVILPDTDLTGALEVARRIRRAVALLDQPHALSPLARLAVSLGVATAAAQATNAPQGLVEAADQALYVSKNEGRDRISTAP